MSELSTAKPSSALFLITHEFYPVSGGIATFAEEIARASASLGYDVEVWAQSAPPDAEKDWPFRMRRLPLKGTHDITCQLKLARELGAAPAAQRDRLPPGAGADAHDDAPAVLQGVPAEAARADVPWLRDPALRAQPPAPVA